MPTLMHARKPIALFCVAMVLLAALIPCAAGLPWAILTPLWLLLAIVATLSIHRAASDSNTPQAPFLSKACGRAPPIA